MMLLMKHIYGKDLKYNKASIDKAFVAISIEKTYLDYLYIYDITNNKYLYKGKEYSYETK